jgi:serine/threonine-protein kinase HipA
MNQNGATRDEPHRFFCHHCINCFRIVIFADGEGVYHGEPVCLAMPIRKEPYRSNHLFPYFYNMLSEGSNRQMQSLLLHIDETDDFGIMLATAQCDTIGAVTVKPV